MQVRRRASASPAGRRATRAWWPASSSPPTRSYWVGCSLGGLEGLFEARRFPGDFDGIVVGTPPNPLASFNAAQLWPGWLVTQNPAGLISKEKYALVHKAVMHACASPREIAVDVLERPDQCAFDPGQLLCRDAEGADCLSAAKVGSGGVERTRTLCAYPQVARYRGTGDPDAAASHLCAQP